MRMKYVTELSLKLTISRQYIDILTVHEIIIIYYSYLSDRIQYVQINRILSELMNDRLSLFT